MDDILNYRSENPDYYKILGCTPSATVEQINSEFKARAIGCHPDKNLDDAAAANKFAMIQKAKETLIDPEKRKLYDAWRDSGLAMGFEQWLAKKDQLQMTMHWASKKSDSGLMLAHDENDADEAFVWKSMSSNDDIISQFRSYKI